MNEGRRGVGLLGFVQDHQAEGELIKPDLAAKGIVGFGFNDMCPLLAPRGG
jgi:hypothetical protein